jgi:hypothetical protein
LNERARAQAANGRRGGVLLSLFLIMAGLVALIVVGILIVGTAGTSRQLSLPWVIGAAIWGVGAVILGFISSRELAAPRVRLAAALWALPLLVLLVRSAFHSASH